MFMSRPDIQIWQVTTEMPNGKLQAYRSTKIGDAIPLAIPLKREGALVILAQLLLNQAMYQIVGHSNDKGLSDASRKNIEKLANIPDKFECTKLGWDLWIRIMGFAVGIHAETPWQSVATIGAHALYLRNSNLLLPKTPGLFPVINFHPNVLVEAVLHGDEIMVRNILETNPDLLQIGKGVDFSGREFTKTKGWELTPLQAAVAVGDFGANEYSKGLCELLIRALERQHPDHWRQIAHRQILALYTKSLRLYAEKQHNKISDLKARKDKRETIDDAVIHAAEQRLQSYLEALDSNDLVTIVNAHTNLDPTKPALDAQKDHVIQVDQALINAIKNATDAEIQAVLDDPNIDSPLSNLIKQFRKEVDNICQSEIIANPQHVLKLFLLYGECYYRFINNPDSNKRELFLCHLVGYVQRYLPACHAQIFANPGRYFSADDHQIFANMGSNYSGNKVIENRRSFDFELSGSIFPLSFHSSSGLGYKFGALIHMSTEWGDKKKRIVPPAVGDMGGLCEYMCRRKTAGLQNFLGSLDAHPLASQRERSSNCVSL